jgi:putative transposase
LIQRQQIAYKTPSGGLERLFGRCLVYIDLNMVRAGVVDHPVKWVNSGYHEIQQPPRRYRVIDLPGLFRLCDFSKLADFQQAHRQWVEIALRDELSVRDAPWSEAVAVGSLAFVEKVKSELGIKMGRMVARIW